jgi:quercetin dioxygenase-like cupin family protein
MYPLAAAAALFAASLPAARADAPVREPLFQKDVELPSAKVRSNLIRVKFAPGAKTPVHTHEGPGPRYILKGSLKVEDAGTVKTYGPGEVFWETGAPMTVENVGGSEAELLIFEMAPQK